MKDVFISYASEDRPVAQQLAAALEQSGMSVWWDRQIQVGSEWDKTIEDALAVAKCVVVLWTGHAKDSRWVRAEAREALNTEKVVPVMLEANAIPLAFTGIQALCFLGWEGAAGSKEFEILSRRHPGQIRGEIHRTPGGLLHQTFPAWENWSLFWGSRRWWEGFLPSCLSAVPLCESTR